MIIDASNNDNPGISNGALAQIGVPDNFPDVPILPVLRNPVFPKFVKLIEVSCCLLNNYNTYIYRGRPQSLESAFHEGPLRN